MVRAECMATIGAVSNPDQANIKLGKAGRKRWLGKRPSVRGVAMNPSTIRMAVAKAAPPAAVIRSRPGASRPRAQRTRRHKKTDALIVRRRHKKK